MRAGHDLRALPRVLMRSDSLLDSAFCVSSLSHDDSLLNSALCVP